jgi:hypothetical protein
VQKLDFIYQIVWQEQKLSDRLEAKAEAEKQAEEEAAAEAAAAGGDSVAVTEP